MNLDVILLNLKKQLLYKKIVKYNVLNSLIIDIVKRDLGYFEIFREIVNESYKKNIIIKKVNNMKNEYSD